MEAVMSGRLTLTWANKDRALLSHGESGYDWVDRDHPWVREVRLLDSVQDGDAGDVTGTASDNLLIRGDSVDALRALVKSPQYAAEYRGKVKLVYIDPPFNTGQAFEHYDDSLEHSVWLGMMRERLVLIRDLLAPDGSVWVHLDDAEMAYCKVLLDEVFGRQNFLATFTWQKMDSPSSNNVAIANYHDFILVYTSDRGTFRATPMGDESILGAYPGTTSDGRLYRDRLLRKNGKSSLRTERPSMWYPIPDPDGGEVWPIDDSGIERRWGMAKATVSRLIEEDAIIWRRRRKPGGDLHWVPYVREYAPSVPTRPWPTLWTDVLMNRQAKSQVKALIPGVATFDTPKPEELIERILLIGSKPGDIVLDAFAGSGTTAAVAHKMGRRWVTVELSEATADTFTAPRLRKVVAGEDAGGVTASAGWEGGGGFRQLRVAPSTWAVEDGEAFLREGVTPGTLARAVAAQLGYAPVEHPVFAGRKGRSQLAVLHGVADRVAVEAIAAALGDGDTALVAALAIADDASTHLSDLRPGSRLIRITTDLFPWRSRVTH
jgi:adenine-specific DNA-methyltransferase